MKTWDEYKNFVRSIDNYNKKSLDEIEEQAAIISEMIKQRKSLCLSQRELATLCGIPQSSVARIESLKTTPTLATLLKILKPLGLKLTITR
ncbi:MAG: helix-turn-helix transcriptional regulator [Clostridia bacterium]|nr:helix-turn-helix transcriptional regulator [Clostridia bacterium]